MTASRISTLHAMKKEAEQRMAMVVRRRSGTRRAAWLNRGAEVRPRFVAPPDLALARGNRARLDFPVERPLIKARPCRAKLSGLARIRSFPPQSSHRASCAALFSDRYSARRPIGGCRKKTAGGREIQGASRAGPILALPRH